MRGCFLGKKNKIQGKGGGDNTTNAGATDPSISHGGPSFSMCCFISAKSPQIPPPPKKNHSPLASCWRKVEKGIASPKNLPVGLEALLKASWSNLPARDISMDGDSTASLGNLVPLLSHLLGEEVFLDVQKNLLGFSLCPLPHVLALDTTENMTPSSHPPFRCFYPLIRSP